MEHWSRLAPGRQHLLDRSSFSSNILLLSLMSAEKLVAIKLCSTVLPCMNSSGTLLLLSLVQVSMCSCVSSSGSLSLQFRGQ